MEHKKSILFINGNLSIGGTEKSLVNLINAIDNTKYDVDLMLFQSGRELEPQLRAGVSVISYDVSIAFGPIKDVVVRCLRQRRWADLLLRLSRICPKKIGSILMKGLSRKLAIRKYYDAVIAYRPGLAEDFALNCVKSKKKLTWWHNAYFDVALDLKSLKYNWRLFDRIVTVSESIAKHVQDVVAESYGKVEVVYNMINPDESMEMAQRPDPFGDTAKLKFVTVSRLSAEKNLERIIDISNELRNRMIEFQWAIIGDGPLYQKLHDLITQNNLEDVVLLKGETTNPYPWMHYADLMIHPSLCESFGLVLVEAMSVGTPCISAKSLGASDVINNNNGILVADEPAEYVNAILLYRDNKVIKDRLIANCRESIRKYSPGEVLNKFNLVIGV